MVKPIPRIQDEDIKKVAQLKDRPNLNGAYGQAKLTAQQLKEWFDQYPAIVRGKVTEILDAFEYSNGDYIKVDFDGPYGCSLADLVNAIFNGDFAEKLIVSFAENAEGESLIAALNGIKEELSKQIVTDKISTGAVTESKIANGAVTNDKISTGAITPDKIYDGAVSTTKIAQSGVQTYNIADEAVTGAKIFPKAVTSDKLDDGVAKKIGDSIIAVNYDAPSGILSFTTNDGNSIPIDLPLELIVTAGNYDDTNNKIVLTLANGDTIEIPVDDLVTELADGIDELAGNVTKLAGNTLNNMKIETFFTGDGFTGAEQHLCLELKNGTFFSIKLDSLVPSKSITETKIADKAVTSEKISPQAVNSTHLGTILGQSINSALRKLSYNATTGNLEASTDVYGISKTTIALPFSEIKNSQAGLEKRVETLEGLTLKTITDDSVAHEKVVPVGVGTTAVVNKLGGMCAMVKKGESHNLCSADGVYECNGYSVDIDLGTLDYLEDGRYYLGIKQDRLSGINRIQLNAHSYGTVQDTNSGQVDLIFQYDDYDFTGLRFYLTIISENEMEEDAPFLSGFVDGIMICKEEDKDKGYTPYIKPELVSAKPTNLESRGANLFDVNGVLDTKKSGNIYISDGKIKDDNASSSGTNFIWYSQTYPAGTYTLGAKVNNSSAESYYHKNYVRTLLSVKTKGSSASLNSHYGGYIYSITHGKTISFIAEEPFKIGFSTIVDTTGLAVEYYDIMLNQGAEAIPYKPYSAEPIDTLTIPEAVQSLDGWGLGINAEHNNHFEVRDGRVIYVQKVEKTVIDGTVNKITYVGKSNDLYYGMLDVARAAIPSINILNSHFKGERVASLGNAYIAGAEAKSLIMFNTNQNLTTVALWNDWLKEEDSKGNPVTSVYALAEPIETDITHLFTDYEDFLYIEVEQGGTLKFVNEEGTKEAIPSTVTYITKA